MQSPLLPFSAILRKLFFLVFSFCLAASSFAATRHFTAASGIWNAAGNWDAGGIPVASDNIIIDAGKICTATFGTLTYGTLEISANASLTVTTNVGFTTIVLDVAGTTTALSNTTGTLVCTGITINNGATFTVSNTLTCNGNLIVGDATSGKLTFGGTTKTMTVTGTAVVSSGGTIIAGTAGSNTLNVTGTFTNNGTYTGLNGVNIITSTTGGLTVGDGATYTMGVTTCASLTVGGGTTGIFEYNSASTARTLTVNGSVLINAGGIFRTNAAGTAANVLTVTSSGNLTNYGFFSGYGTLTSTIATTIAGNLIVKDGGTFTMGANTTCASLTVGDGASGTFQYNPGATARTLIVTGNITVNSGATLQAGTASTVTNLLNAGGDFTNAGTFTPVLGTNKLTLTFNSATASQSFSNTGVITGSLISSLTINNTFGGTVAIPNNLTMIDGSTLTLTSGIVNTSLLTMGTTAATTLTGGNATSFINGALVRSFATSSAAIAQSNLFPVGRGTIYMPINLAPTNPSLLVQLKAEAFTSGTGTNISTTNTVSTHYWAASVVSVPASNLTSVLIKATDALIVATDMLLRSTSANGVYQTVSTGSSSVVGAVTAASAMSNAEFTGSGYFSFGTGCFTNPAITGPNNICIGAISQLYTVAGSNNPATGAWASSATGVATVDAAGNVTGISAGPATITLTIASADGCNAIPVTRIVNINSCSVTPGGAGNNLISWYKGDAGLTATTWTDQAGTNTLTSGGAPTVITSTLNFNPVASFGGTADYFGNTAADGWQGSIAGSTYFYVAASTATGNRVVYGKGVTTGVNTSAHGGRRTTNNAIFASGNVASGIAPVVSGTSPIWSTTPTNLSRGGFTGGTGANYYVSANGGTEVAATASTPTIAGNAPFYIGRAATSGSFWQGDIAEVIAFNGKQPGTDYKKVESYLAFKYGITLSPAQDYLASNGTTKMWNAAAAATGFSADIFGIGQDNGSGLNQKVAKSISSDSVLFIATTNDFILGNTDVSRTATGNLNFETIANNNSTNTFTATNALPGYKILNRQWQVQETGTIGTVYVQFDTANAAFTIPGRIFTSSPFFIITDPNANGNYNDGTATALSNTTGSLWSTGIDFANGNKFTIAIPAIYAGVDTFVCSTSTTVYALAGACGAGSGIWTEAPGNPAGVSLGTTTVTGINGTASADFTTATPGVYYFIYTAAGFADTVSVTFSNCVAPGGVPSNLWLWVKGDAGVTATANQVSGWTNQSVISMTSQATKTASSHVTYLSNGINFNPVVNFDGTDLENLAGSYAVTPPIPNSIAVIFAVVAPSAINGGTGAAGCCANPYAMGPAGGLGITYNNSTYQPDGSGGFGNSTVATALNEPAIIRVTYPLVGTDIGTIMAKNGLAQPASTSGAGVSDFAPADGFQIGGRTFGGQISRIFPGKIAEVIHYNAGSLSTLQINQIESYLALKYGLMLDNSAGGTAGDILLSNGSTAWSANSNAAYHHQVIGLVRDANSGIAQKQSHTADDSLRVFVGSLAADNASNTATITNDKSSLMIGNNGGTQRAATSSMPAGIVSMFGRSWKITNNNFTGTYSIEIKWDSTGPFNINDIRLLVSSGTDFSGATVIANGSMGITISLGSIIVSGIGTSVIPINSTSFITIGSASTSTTLPVQISHFNANVVENNKVAVSWQTVSETNSDYFSVEKSADGINWETVTTVKGAGNSSSPKSYSAVDKTPYTGVSYYRLKQTDLDGKFNYTAIKTVKVDITNNSVLNVYPNPVANQLTIKADAAELKTIRIYDIKGQDVTANVKTIQNNGTTLVLDVSKLTAGNYSIKTKTGITKLVKQ